MNKIKIAILTLVVITALANIDTAEAFVLSNIFQGTYIDYSSGNIKEGIILVFTEYDDEPNDIYPMRHLVLSETVYLVPSWTLNLQQWWQDDLINDGTYENTKRYLVNSGIAKLVQ